MNKNSVFAIMGLVNLLLMGMFTSGYAQSPRPKIGLVLSGGGAKGIAHVRILQVLDSLSIVPDYIAGTSMGSVVGGLYAAGYTGHQIDSITKSIHWADMFSNSVSFDEINIEEKDEFGRYIYELPLKGLKAQFPLGLVEGQKIEELLASLFFPVNKITDFNKLPTPFLCVAADIVKGEPVILRKGSLAASIRASMSIPTVFSPVRIDGKLLVDGGVYMNLPVTYCREMGADYIIAVDVGGGLLKEEEITSAASMLVQTTFLSGNISYQQEKEKSDIFIDVVKHLKYSTMDFEQGASIMQSGDIAVKEAMKQLVDLSKSLKAYPTRKVKHVKQFQDKYKIETIKLDGISEANENFVVEKFGRKSGDLLTREQIGSSVHKLLGTRLFDKINYTIDGDSTQSTLTLRAKEKTSNAIKFGIHYDVDRGAGLILNFTKRNLFIRSSRLVTTLDLAENPRGRFNYFYYLGKKLQWWHFTEVYGEKVIQNSFINGTPIPDILSRHVSLTTQLNRTINNKSYIGFGILGQWNTIKPKIDPRDELIPDPLSIIKYQVNTWGAKLHYQYNTFDKVYFPTTGAWLRIEAKGNFNNPVSGQLLVYDDSTSTELQFDDEIRSYLRFNLKTQKNIQLHKRTTLQLIGQAGFTQEALNQTDKSSAYDLGAGDFISIGGLLQRPRPNNFTFYGLGEGELLTPQVMTLGAQVQYTVSKNIYVTPAINILAAGYDASEFWSTLGKFDFGESNPDQAFYQLGYGLSAGYMSLIGPIQFAISNNAQLKEFRAFFSIGFTL